jgi:hypothetical protein
VFTDRAVPLWDHPTAGGDPPEQEEVDPELTVVAQLGLLGLRLESELLDGVGDRAGQMSEAHPRRRFEVDRLEGASLVEVDLREVRCDDQRLAASEDIDIDLLCPSRMSYYATAKDYLSS